MSVINWNYFLIIYLGYLQSDVFKCLIWSPKDLQFIMIHDKKSNKSHHSRICNLLSLFCCLKNDLNDYFIIKVLSKGIWQFQPYCFLQLTSVNSSYKPPVLLRNKIFLRTEFSQWSLFTGFYSPTSCYQTTNFWKIQTSFPTEHLWLHFVLLYFQVAYFAWWIIAQDNKLCSFRDPVDTNSLAVRGKSDGACAVKEKPFRL